MLQFLDILKMWVLQLKIQNEPPFEHDKQISYIEASEQLNFEIKLY